MRRAQFEPTRKAYSKLAFSIGWAIPFCLRLGTLCLALIATVVSTSAQTANLDGNSSSNTQESTVLGIAAGSMPQTNQLVRIDTMTGQLRTIVTLTGFSGVPTGGTSALDVAGQRFFIFLSDAAGSEHLVTIDTRTDAVLYSPVSAGLLTLEFDPSTGALFGVVRDQVSGNFDLDTVDPITGDLQPVTSIPGFSGGASGCPTAGVAALSNSQHRYFTLLDDGAGTEDLLTINTSTGEVVASPSSAGALVLEFDSATDTLLGITFNQTSSLFSLVAVDPQTGGVKSLTSIPGFAALPTGCVSAFDPAHQTYIGILTDSSGMDHFVTVNTETKSVSASPPTSTVFDIELETQP